METINLSWEEIDALAYQAAAKIEAEFYPEFDVVFLVGISRGGLIPSVLISHHLKDLIGKVESYLPTVYPVNAVIIDDVLDTGKIFRDIHAEQQRHGNPKVSYCTLTHKVDKTGTLLFGPKNLLFRGQDYDLSQWLIFPWEKEKENDS